MTWSENKNLKKAIDRDRIKLLAFHQTAEWNSLDRFGIHESIMITVSITLIAAGAAAVAGDNKILVLAAMLVPMFVALLRRYTIETLDRYYARFLEAAVVQSKLRFILGLGSHSEAPHPDDEFLEVTRMGDNKPGKGSALWIRKHLEKGHNNVVWRIFRALCWASVILPVAGGMQLLTWPNDPIFNCSLMAPGLIVAVVVASLVAMGWAYDAGTRHITKKRDVVYGQLPKKATQTERPSVGR